MIKHIGSNEIESALQKNPHQYLAGNLKRPQVLNHIRDDRANVGIGTHSQCECEKAHYHPKSREYQFCLKGEAEYYDLDNGNTVKIKEGDFFVIEENTKYSLRAHAGCRILFFKVPAVDDKVLIE